MLNLSKVFIGIACVAAGVFARMMKTKENNFIGMALDYVGSPIWAGLLILTGSNLGIVASTRRQMRKNGFINRCSMSYSVFLITITSFGLTLYIINSLFWCSCLGYPISRSTHVQEWYASRCDALTQREVRMGSILSFTMTGLLTVTLIVELLSTVCVNIFECCNCCGTWHRKKRSVSLEILYDSSKCSSALYASSALLQHEVVQSHSTSYVPISKRQSGHITHVTQDLTKAQTNISEEKKAVDLVT